MYLALFVICDVNGLLVNEFVCVIDKSAITGDVHLFSL